jgi:dolichol-phosphate mannosyltransferase
VSVPELSVVVPVHNEAESIGVLLDEVRRALVGIVPFEIVVVDDKSADDTLVCRVPAL